MLPKAQDSVVRRVCAPEVLSVLEGVDEQTLLAEIERRRAAKALFESSYHNARLAPPGATAVDAPAGYRFVILAKGDGSALTLLVTDELAQAFGLLAPTTQRRASER